MAISPRTREPEDEKRGQQVAKQNAEGHEPAEPVGQVAAVPPEIILLDGTRREDVISFGSARPGGLSVSTRQRELQTPVRLPAP